jgi:signal transduction protein with GAF and PtsI domain
VLKGKEKDFKTLHEAHAALSKKYKLTRGMANLFLNSLDLERNVEAAMNFFMEAVDAEAGSILLIDEDKQDMYFAAARGTKADEIKSFRLPLGKGIGGACAKDKETIAVSDVKKDARFSKEIDQALGFETRSILAVPLVFKNTALGAAEVINKQGSDVFTSGEIALCQDIARFLAALLAIGDRLRG